MAIKSEILPKTTMTTSLVLSETLGNEKILESFGFVIWYKASKLWREWGELLLKHKMCP
jgi:hypothetical protein